MPRLNRRMLRLLVPLLVVLVLVVVVRLACSGDGGTDPTAAGPATPDPSGRLEVAVGEEATLDGVVVLVTVLAPVDTPALPVTAVGGSPVRSPGPGEGFYQAMAVLRNGGPRAVHYDPWDFVLLADGARVSIDPSRSGPPPKSLLPGASLDVVLTFVAPAGLEPGLEYTSTWSGVRVIVKGERKPAGMASVGTGGPGLGVGGSDPEADA